MRRARRPPDIEVPDDPGITAVPGLVPHQGSGQAVAPGVHGLCPPRAQTEDLGGHCCPGPASTRPLSQLCGLEQPASPCQASTQKGHRPGGRPGLTVPAPRAAEQWPPGTGSSSCPLLLHEPGTKPSFHPPPEYLAQRGHQELLSGVEPALDLRHLSVWGMRASCNPFGSQN